MPPGSLSQDMHSYPTYLVVDVVGVDMVLSQLQFEVTRLTARHADRLQLSALEPGALVVGERDVAHVAPLDASHVFYGVRVLVACKQL